MKMKKYSHSKKKLFKSKGKSISLPKDKSMTKFELLGELTRLRKRMVKFENLDLIADSKMSAKRQREVEEASRMVTVARDSNDAITIQDLKGKITAWNRGAELMFGYSEEEALQMTIWQLAPPNKAAEQKDFNRRIFAGEKVASFETQRLTKDGRRLDVWMVVTKLVDAEGKVIGIASTERDITERKRAEEVLREANEYLDTLFNYANVPVIVWDRQFKITRFNPAFESLTGRKSKDVVGGPLEVLFPPSFVESSMELIRNTLGGESWKTVEIAIIHLDGSVRTLLWNSATIFADDGKTPIAAIAQGHDITERKQAEEVLRQSEDKYRMLSEFTYDWVYWLDNDHSFIYSSPSCERITGHTDEEFINDPTLFLRIIHPDDRALMVDHRKTYGSNPDHGDLNFRIICKDGSEKWIGHVCQPIITEDGRYLGRRSGNRDITERKRAEEGLKKSQHLLAETEKIGKIGGWEFNVDTGKQTWTEEVCVIHEVDLTYDPTVEKGVNFYAPASRPIIAEAVKRAIEHGEPFDVELEIITAKGNLRSVHAIGKADLENRRVHGLFQDITERKKAEAELAVAQQLYRELFENVNVGILRSTPGPEGAFIDVNPAMVKMFEADNREQLMALHPSEIYWDASQRKIVNDTIVAKGFTNEEIKFKTLKGKPLLCHINSVKKTDANGKVYFDSTIEDFTERRQAEALLKQTLEDLKHSNAELEQFAYVTSHDLQEPLRMVASYMQLIEKRYKGKLDADADEFIGYAVDGAVRMKTMINDLLNFSRLGTKGKEAASTDCQLILSTVLTNLSMVIEESKAEITSDPLPLVKGDEAQLVRLFQNLLENAIKFRGGNTPRIHISCKPQNGFCLFSIRDNGIGIDSRYFDRIFIIFQRLHGTEQYPGTGIGLAMCKKIVDRHRGKIWIESEPGKGTTFYFTLPKA